MHAEPTQAAPSRNTLCNTVGSSSIQGAEVRSAGSRYWASSRIRTSSRLTGCTLSFSRQATPTYRVLPNGSSKWSSHSVDSSRSAAKHWPAQNTRLLLSCHVQSLPFVASLYCVRYLAPNGPHCRFCLVILHVLPL